MFVRRRLILFAAILIIAVAGIVVFANHRSNTVKDKAAGAKTAADLATAKSSSSVGTYLTDSNDRALYTYTKDTAGVSNCDGDCLKTWPPYKAQSSNTLPANWGTAKRGDGSLQYTYKNTPLYYYSEDSAPDDVSGNGVDGFYIAKP